jgi:hypothetical protein
VGVKVKDARIFLTLSEISERCGKTTETLRNWVARGSWPLPHDTIEKTMFFRRSVIEHWEKTGEWPEGTKFIGQGGRRSSSAQVD